MSWTQSIHFNDVTTGLPMVTMVRDGISGIPLLTYEAFTQEDGDMFKRSVEHTYPKMRERREDDEHVLDPISALKRYAEAEGTPITEGLFNDWCELWKEIASDLSAKVNLDEPVDSEIRSDRRRFLDILDASLGEDISNFLFYVEDTSLPDLPADNSLLTACHDLHERLPVVHRVALLSIGRCALELHAPFLLAGKEILEAFQDLADTEVATGNSRSDLIRDIDYLLRTNSEYTMENLRQYVEREHKDKQDSIDSALTLLSESAHRDWMAIRDGIETLSQVCGDPDSQDMTTQKILNQLKQLPDESSLMDAIESLGKHAQRSQYIDTWVGAVETGSGEVEPGRDGIEPGDLFSTPSRSRSI